MRVLSVVGNRPQFIKSAPLSAALREAGIDEVVLHTGQHYDPELSEVFFDELGLAEPRYRLDLRDAPTRTRCGPAIREAVDGRASPTGCSSTATRTRRSPAREAAGASPIAHVEAGLRSFDLVDAGGAQPDRGRPAVGAAASARTSARRGSSRARASTGRRRGRRRRDGRRRPALRADRARALGRARAARRSSRAATLLVTVHREANVQPGAAARGSSRGCDRARRADRLPRAPAHARRARRGSGLDAAERSSRSATSTSPRSRRRRA